MTDVKICGLTREADVEAACELGAAYVGFNFASSSPRRVDLARGRRLAAEVPPGVRRVGVFVGESFEEIAAAIGAGSLDLVQLHRTLSAEDLERIPVGILAVAHTDRDDSIPPAALLERCAAILFDTGAAGTSGGSGVAFNWSLLEGRGWPVPLFVAGGLRPENVGESIRLTKPSAVDVASGVETSPGVKDHDRMRRFFQAVRDADAAR
ncbi:MAG TPA: phosphoribosylanthranilate isomerase [Thermoanaerobaculia bacterium]|nr:phosphoribosylanthranilate isomerase [Thermoanaerobaculia bacterium]